MNIKVDYCFYKEYIKLDGNFEIKMKQRIKDINPDYNTNTLFQWRRIFFFGPGLIMLFSLFLDFYGTKHNIPIAENFFGTFNKLILSCGLFGPDMHG